MSNPFAAHVDEEGIEERTSKARTNGGNGLEAFLEIAKKTLVVLYIHGAKLLASVWDDQSGSWQAAGEIPHSMFKTWLAGFIIEGKDGWMASKVLASTEEVPPTSSSYWRALRTGVVISTSPEFDTGMFASYWVTLAILAGGEYPRKEDFARDYLPTIAGEEFREPVYKNAPASQEISRLAREVLAQAAAKGEQQKGRRNFRLMAPKPQPTNPQPNDEDPF